MVSVTRSTPTTAARCRGLHGAVQGQDGELQSGDHGRELPATVGGDREQDDQAGHARGGREGLHRNGGKPEGNWPAPPPQQSEGERRATNHVENQQGRLQTVVDLVSQRQRAEGGR